MRGFLASMYGRGVMIANATEQISSGRISWAGLVQRGRSHTASCANTTSEIEEARKSIG
jgi:hypothetical protein